MKIRKSTILIIILFLVGLSVTLYPTISNLWNSRTQSRAIATYQEAVEQLDSTATEELFEAAEAYNEALAGLSSPLTDYESLDADYWETLDISGTGIMGYITIEKIDVQLPIYHGTAQEVLQIAAGHLEGSSLPVGGAGTHSVLSGHRGLPSSKLFTDLDELTEGDMFTVTVLDRTFAYEVDQILTVLPEEYDALAIEEGQDYVTLITCTPYGINTHRLLVRGHRVEYTEEEEAQELTEEEETGTISLCQAAVPAAIAAALLVLAIFLYKKKKKKNSENS